MIQIPLPKESAATAFQFGDGFFPFKGTVTVDSVLRNKKDLNCEVVPGYGLTVKVRGYYALIDGSYVMSNSRFMEVEKFTTLSVSVGTSYVVLTPKAAPMSNGTLSIAASAPAVDSGKLLVATIIVPPATTQVLAGMINNTTKTFLYDLVAVSGGLKGDKGDKGDQGDAGAPGADGATVLTASDFLDDAAAAVGLIPVGGLYHTAGVVKIRLV